MKNSKKVFVYFSNKAIISNTSEAIEFINSLPGITCNDHTKKLLDQLFDQDQNLFWKNQTRIDVATTGIGPNRIYVYDALADTLQAHDLIIDQRKIQAEIIRDEKANERFQEFMDEAHMQLRGWYEVTIKYAKDDLKKGGHKWTYLNGRVIANSMADAYKKGCDEIEKKQGYGEESMQSALINYVGILTDEYLMNE